MLRKLVNEAYFTLRITTTGPILIRSGHATVSGPDMTPVLTFRNGRQEVYLPGSSLKGVFRSHLEKIICSIKPGVACYPFWGNEAHENDQVVAERQRDYRDSCSGRFVDSTRKEGDRRLLEERTDAIYNDCCPVCRLFGSTGFIGRVAIGDASLASHATLEVRDGVGIDRLTGGAAHGAKFELEVVSSGVSFETDIHLRNFEIWQLGMLFIVLQDLEDELIRIGSGRSRGLGQVKAEVSLEAKNSRRPGGVVTSVLRESGEPENELWGLGHWLAGQKDVDYGTMSNDLLKLDKLSGELQNRGIRRLRTFTGDALDTLREKAIQNFLERMQAWPVANSTESLLQLARKRK